MGYGGGGGSGGGGGGSGGSSSGYGAGYGSSGGDAYVEKSPLQPTPVGAIRFNTDSSKLEYYDGNQWVNITGARDPDGNSGGGSRGINGSGWIQPAATNIIEYINISATGNALDFGDLTNAEGYRSACSSFTRGYWFNGQNRLEIDTVNIKSTGNATDFGDATNDYNQTGACSDKTRGMRLGGADGGVIYANMYYITMATEGTTTSFGNLSATRYAMGGCSSPTRGLAMGGNVTPISNIIDYWTIQSTGNAVDFGDLTWTQRYCGNLSNSVRALAYGGDDGSGTKYNHINYVTISTLGNAADFGDLDVARSGAPGTASATRGVIFNGGTADSSPNGTNVIQYVTIATLGNTVDFGDSTMNNQALAGATSDCHGGLG